MRSRVRVIPNSVLIVVKKKSRLFDTRAQVPEDFSSIFGETMTGDSLSQPLSERDAEPEAPPLTRATSFQSNVDVLIRTYASA